MNTEIFKTDEYKANTGIVLGMYGGIGFYDMAYNSPKSKLKLNLFRTIKNLLSVVW